jgi:F-type H+-transporting ATPase subunit alpha
LERACRLSKEFGGGSITALPIVETQAGDISAYIPTNIISITDGQIFLITDYFAAGQRPAVDSGFSVSRVGSSAQTKAMKQVASSLKIELASYREMLSFAQFGSDLDAATKKILTHGAILMETLKQKQYAPYPMWKQVVELYAVKQGYLDALAVNKVAEYLSAMDAYIESNYKDFLKELNQKKAFTPELEATLNQAIQAYSKSRE